jgi:hypothetical protein
LVYVVQGSDLGKFRKAERFGVLEPLILLDVYPDNVEERVPVILDILHRKLRNFNPTKDFLLVSGDPIAIAASVMVLTIHNTVIPCLKWDRENQDYYVVELSV